MNKVIISGRIATELELKQTKKGTATLSFNVAVDRYGSDDADFIRCVAWSKNAEFIKTHFFKGKAINLEGNIKTGSYEKDGNKVFTTDVWIDRVEFPIQDKHSDIQPAHRSNPSDQSDSFDDEVISDSELPF